MSNKQAKALRKHFRHNFEPSYLKVFMSIQEEVCSLPLKNRIRIALKILRRAWHG